jgi:diketogulonate reductase-like aldo/keto reductase
MGKISNLPKFIYGTAWKEAATKELVLTAINAGFRAIDTANQAKHYQEKLVGDALSEIYPKIPRKDIWIQSKFTSTNGQDHRLPYDPKATIFDQVKQSFASSLEHLHTNYLDSYLLHGPYNYPSLGDEDFEAWAALEDLYQSKQTLAIGISNVNISQLELLHKHVEIKPMMVQNRCFASTGWDLDVRKFCKENGIIYQGFSLLTANDYILSEPEILSLADKYKMSPIQIIFRFAHQIGMIPLTGTSNKEHMQHDLEIFNFKLDAKDMRIIEKIAF